MEEMTPRDRVRRALNHQEPDRVPVDFGGWACGITPPAYVRLREYLGLDPDPGLSINNWLLVNFNESGEDVLKRLRTDFRRVFLHPSKDETPFSPTLDHWTDEWGLVKRRIALYSRDGAEVGSYMEIVQHPLENATIDDLDTYAWPDPHDPTRYQGVAERALDLHENTSFAIVAGGIDGSGGGLFERAQAMRGMEKFLLDLACNQLFARRLIEKVAEWQVKVTEHFLDLVGPVVDMVETSDDYGMQTGLMISPSTYRAVIKESHCRLLAAIRARTSAKVFHHSCGSVVKILDELIDTGIDVINPVQPRAAGMDPAALKLRFGHQLVFHGAVDLQVILRTGSPQSVRAEVNRLIQVLASGGGYVVAPAHNFQDDVPPENIVALYDAAFELGQYPLTQRRD